MKYVLNILKNEKRYKKNENFRPFIFFEKKNLKLNKTNVFIK